MIAMAKMTREQGGYEPDLVFPPGETLREVLEERSMSQAEVAARMMSTSTENRA